MDDPTSSNINNRTPIRKKIIPVGGGDDTAMVVLIDESIVKQLLIDENCWMEQIPTNEGVLLKVSRGGI
jgi:hypothetical protein